MLTPTENKLNVIADRLGKPSFRYKNIRLYMGDSLALLAELPTGCLDLTVTSPPYNIGKEYEIVKGIDDYVNWCVNWLLQLHRLTSPSGALWLNLGYLRLAGKGKAIPIPYLLWDKIPFYLLQEVVWNYGAGVTSKRAFAPRNEKFLWYTKSETDYVFNLDEVRDPDVKYPNQKKNGKLKCNPLGKNPGDVWYFAKVTSGANRQSAERTPHPAQFPVAVIDRIVKACSNGHELLCDPFFGSGTVAEVALRNDRAFVGFEISSNYVDIAVERIERAINSRHTLFEKTYLAAAPSSISKTSSPSLTEPSLL